MIFKVLVIGDDLPLQTGFLSRASGECISYQLYTTLGVSLGVSRFDYPEDLNVILQLWSLPSAERVRGLSKSYVKGHRAIVVVVRSSEIESIPSIMQNLDLTTETLFLIVVVGNSIIETEDEIRKLGSFFETEPSVQAIQSVGEAVGLVANHLVNREREIAALPIVASITEDNCPPFEPQPPISSTPPNSDTEIQEISEIAMDLGLRVVEDNCAITLSEGTAWVSMRTGAASIEPQLCRFCIHQCKRKSNLCIIGVDSGWSSENLQQRALLTIAKIHALRSRRLPHHVEKQIHSASTCSRFQLNPESSIDEIPDCLLKGFQRTESRKTLLEVARERVKEGRLSEAGYSMLKKKLNNLETTRS